MLGSLTMPYFPEFSAAPSSGLSQSEVSAILSEEKALEVAVRGLATGLAEGAGLQEGAFTTGGMPAQGLGGVGV